MPVLARQSSLGPSSGQVSARFFSVTMPVRAGPRYWGQLSATAGRATARARRRVDRMGVTEFLLLSEEIRVVAFSSEPGVMTLFSSSVAALWSGCCVGQLWRVTRRVGRRG